MKGYVCVLGGGGALCIIFSADRSFVIFLDQAYGLGQV